MASGIAATVLVGGVLALDFANTIGDGVERLTDADDVLDWALRAGVIDAAAAEQYRRDLELDPKRPEALLRCARNLRDLLLTLGRAFANETPPEKDDLARLRTAAADALKNAELRSHSEGGYAVSFENGSAETAILGPIIWSAMEMLRDGQFERVKQCPECAFLFFDRSKNNSRRWCDMAICGNRAKLRNFRERRR